MDEIEVNKKGQVKKIGRPSRYSKKLCHALIEHMGKGYSFSSFGGKIGVDKETLFKWTNEHKDFSNAKEIGLLANLYQMEKIGAKAMMGGIPGFKDRIWLMFMKNVHAWKDRVDITSDDETIEPVQIFLPDNGLRINEDE